MNKLHKLNLHNPKFLALDTETTGLLSDPDAKPFAIAFAWYHDNKLETEFLRWDWEDDEACTWAGVVIETIIKGRTINFMHNALFDMHMIDRLRPYRAGVFEFTNVHCTQAIARALDNNLMSYSLDALTGQKDDLKKYMTEHKLYEMVGGKKMYKYHEVPGEMLKEYAINDAVITLKLGNNQYLRAKEECPIYETETALTKVLYRMERAGVDIIDRHTIHKKVAAGYADLGLRKSDYKSNYGFEVGSRTGLKEYLEKSNIKYAISGKGNPVFDKEALTAIDIPATKDWLEYKAREKVFSTYLVNLLPKDGGTTVRCSFNQGGTVTGRMSCKEPNLQNQPKGEIRKNFRPRNGWYFVSIDYSQMEYMILLEYLNNKQLIEKVREGGDVHQATSEMVNCSRDEAKTINFLTIYGGGVAALAEKLFSSPVPLETLKDIFIKHVVKGEMYEHPKLDECVDILLAARNIRGTYFQNIPGLRDLMKRVEDAARARGWIKNIMGRKIKFRHDSEVRKALNHLVQGSAGDIIKKAMVEVDDFLTDMESRILLQVHDELLLEMPENELIHAPRVADIMSSAWTPRFIPKLKCDIEVSKESWGNLKKLNLKEIQK